MEYPILPLERPLEEAKFVARPNRFLAHVELNGVVEKAHVHDPGRLRELLYPGNRVLVSRPSRGSANRKTSLDLLFAFYDGDWILVNSALHRPISQKILSLPELSPFGAVKAVVPEVRFGTGTRFDYLLELDQGRSCYLEVKGCTLEDEVHRALFPDAPTLRGSRHLEELMEARSLGHEAALLFLILRPKARSFAPNAQCDPRFARLFWECVQGGVRVFMKKIAFKKGWFVYTGDIHLEGGAP